MMIKGSLLRSVPIVKRFGRKFLSPKMDQKFEVLGVLKGKNFNPNNQTSLGNQSPPKYVIWRKNGVDRLKNVVSIGGQENL